MRILGILLLATAACQSPKEARSTAKLLAAHTNTVKSEAAAFAKARTAIDKARQANINYIEQSTLHLEQGNALDLRVWEIGGQKEKAALYKSIRSATEEARAQAQTMTELREKHAKIVASTRDAVNVRNAKLAEVAKALSGIAEPPDFASTVRFYVAFFKEVRDSYEEAKNAAKEQADKGEQEAKASTDAAKKTTTPPSAEGGSSS